LEVESHGQEEMIARQASELNELKTTNQKSEDELTRNIEENGALKGQLARLKEEMKVKQDPLLKEIGRLKEEIRQMTARMQQPPEPAPMEEPEVPPPPKPAKQFPPLVKKLKTKSVLSWQKRSKIEIDVPDGIIAHLTRECGGNVHDRHVVDVTCGSFEKETEGANPHSGAYYNWSQCAAKNAADLESDSIFRSAYRPKKEDIRHTRNNWICYDFKERRIVPTHYTIRTNGDYGTGYSHLKSWLVETSADGKNWREVAREENNTQLNGKYLLPHLRLRMAGSAGSSGW
jgi:hypothetical protein